MSATVDSATPGPDAGAGPPEVLDAVRDPVVDRIPRPVSVVAFGLLMAAIWQLAYNAEVISPLILPSPGETFGELLFVGGNILAGDYVFEGMFASARAILAGFMLAVALGFLLGSVVGETRFGERVIMPYLVAVDASPKIAFAPLIIAWLGFGLNSKIAMAAFVSFFPMLVNTAAGLYSTERDSLMLFQSMEATRWQTFRQLKLPTALPYVFAGMKIAAVSSVVGAVVAEYLGGGTGMGELVRVSATQLRVARVLALIFYLSLVGLFLFGLMGWLQRRLVFWHEPDTTETTGAA